jgi:ERCC4-type nuclease
MREVQQEDVAASTSVAKLPEVDEDTKKFEALVTDGIATKEQVQAITSFWEIKSWEDFANLSEAELTQTKGIGKATATKILASLNKG